MPDPPLVRILCQVLTGITLMAHSCTLHPEAIISSTAAASWLRSPVQGAHKTRVYTFVFDVPIFSAPPSISDFESCTVIQVTSLILYSDVSFVGSCRTLLVL